MSHRFFRYQVIITKFQNLKIVWTPGSNLAFPDILSRNVTIDEYQHHQLQHKKLPRDIQFFDKHGQQIKYQINHDDTSAETCNDFYPIHCQQGKNQKILRFHNDGEVFSLNSISNDFSTYSVQSAADCLPELYIQFFSSTHHFTTSFLTSVIPYPTKIFTISPGRPCYDRAQQNGRRIGKKKKEDRILLHNSV